MPDDPLPTLIATADTTFAEAALAELRVAAGNMQVLGACAPGVWRVGGVPFFSLSQTWLRRPPIFIRHICPVQEVMALPDDPAQVPAQIVAMVDRVFVPLFEPDLPFSIQTRIFGNVPCKPFDVNTPVATYLRDRHELTLDVRNPQQILSIVIDEQGIYLGLSLARQNLSDWAGGVHRFAREKGQISRAEFKLLEAIDLFGIELPPRGVALDLGAAPGGWTRVLRQREQYVTAVDPAWLHPSLQKDKGVRHLRLTAETYLEQFPDTFDFIVNDMRLDARDSARLMVSYAAYLYQHGTAIMTLKLPQERYETALDHALNILKKAYRVVNARQLFHNRSEITVHMTRRPR